MKKKDVLEATPEQREQNFIVSVVVEDVPEHLREDLAGHIRGAIGDLLKMDADIGFSVEALDPEEVEEYESTRICTACGAVMTEGYCIGDGESYYCSDKCLHTAMTQEEYMELYNEDCAYWTQWD